MLKERKSLCQLIEVTDKQLHEMNYSQAVIYSYRRCWRELIEYAEERNVTYYSVELGEKYLLEKRGIDIYADKKTLNLPIWKINPFMRAINVLTDMQNIGVIRKIYHVDRIKLPENYSNIAEQFCSKCRQRYNSERTIIAKDFAVKRFLNHLIQTKILSIDSITLKDITSYLKTTISWSQRTVASAICNLKQFLSFLYEEKYIKTDISLWIPTANHGRAATLPNIWTQDDIERLLSSVDRANPIGKRDYAILLLAARLGLRDSDVQNLTFSNILWKECRISLVQTKTKRALDLPITEEIGNAIIEYLKYGRPKHIVSDYIFVRHSAPYDKCNNYYHIMRKYLQRAGISFDSEKKHGLHTLRHTLATRMLECDVPLQTIAEVLGHSSSNSTKEYLQVDIKGLCKCALNPDEVYDDERI